jgi:hypothetical protein
MMNAKNAFNCALTEDIMKNAFNTMLAENIMTYAINASNIALVEKIL